MNYTGEHLLPGQLGHFFIILSLVASLVATFAYYKSAQAKQLQDEANWKKLARYSFITQSISVFAVFGILFYIIQNHLFEYHYAWKHSNRALEFKYLLSCFWEGQEGSFLLWSIWQSVLGLILIKTSKRFEAPVMTVMSFAQFAMASMLLGIYFGGAKIGLNPFILLRDSGVLDNAPALHINFDITQPLKQDYLASITDGNGLNILLQNYWMVIHPPVLFLGFASVIVPFAYSVAGLWKKQFGEVNNPALPWALFSAAVLGVGIMMGGIWAYESLSFGGYWAWDPVENASLVPWMILVSGIHAALIYKHTGQSLRSTHLFYILSFVFVLYSTFLTKTGVLQNTSVHAFTGEGANFKIHIFIFLLLFLLFPLVLWASKYRDIPSIKKEEEVSSREFWLYIGSLVFFLSAIVIIAQTSAPVISSKTAPPEDAEYRYNSIQIYVAIIIALLTAISQYLKYKETPGSMFWKKILVPIVISAILATLVLAFGNVNYIRKGPGFQASIWVAVACSIFAIVANASYIWIGLKGKLRFTGGSVAHVGFGMVLLGILLSSAKKEILSNNKNGIPVPVAEGENPMENLTLVEGVPMDMGKYMVTFEGDTTDTRSNRTYFNIRFKRKDGKEEFLLRPNSFINPNGQEGLMSNPDARHYLSHDIFTYITSVSNPDAQRDTSTFKIHKIRQGDTVYYSSGFIVLQNVTSRDNLPEDIFGKDGSLYEAPVKVFSKNGTSYSLTSRLAFAKKETIAVPDTVTAENLVIQLQKVNADKTVEIGVKESEAMLNYITIKSYKFPFILVLWAGVVITAIGLFISMFHRISQNRKKNLQE